MYGLVKHVVLALFTGDAGEKKVVGCAISLTALHAKRPPLCEKEGFFCMRILLL
jgi:hypothetical protein